MRIPALLLAALTACVPGEPAVRGAWEILEASGRPHDLFVAGRTLQFTEGDRAWVSGSGMQPVRRHYEAFRAVSIDGEDALLVLFDGDPSAYIVRQPSRTELVLEENDIPATILKLRRIR